MNKDQKGTTTAMDGAASFGHFEIVLYLNDHRHEGCTLKTLDAAVACYPWEFVKWFGSNQTEGGTLISLRKAALCGNFEMVKFLTMQCNIYGDLDTLLYILKSVRPYDMVEWLLEQYWDVDHVVEEVIASRTGLADSEV